MAHLIVFGGLGMLAGSAARALLARLPRGALVPPPWCELVVGALWATCGCGWSSGLLPTRWLPLMLGLAWLGVAAGTVDLMHRRLPDALTLPAGPLALAAALPLGAPVVLRAAVCGMVLVGAHMAVRALAPAALGAGDVKLAGSLGVVLGAVSWPAVVLGAVLASVLTLVGATVAQMIGRRAVHGLPHGPSMLVAAWLVLIVAAAGATVTGAPT